MGGAMMTTLLHRHPEQYLHKSRFTRHLQCFRDVGPSCIAWLNTLRSATSASLWLNTLRSATNATLWLNTLRSATNTTLWLNTLRSTTNATLCLARYTLRSATNATLWAPLRHKRDLGGMMTTLLHRHPEQYLYKSRFTRYLQYIRDIEPSYIAWLNTLRSATSATSRTCSRVRPTWENIENRRKVHTVSEIHTLVI